MKYKFHIITKASCILLIFLNACEKELDYIPGEKEPQIVVNCLFADGEPFKVYLSTSFSPFSDTKPQIIQDAKVEIFENDRSMGFLTFQKKYVYQWWDSAQVAIDSFFTNNTILPVAENIYRIEITVPGYKKITASSRIPSKIVTKPITSDIKWEEREGRPYGFYLYRLGFTDPPETNYYHVYAIRYHHDPAGDRQYYLPVPFFSKDPVISESNIIGPHTMFYSFSDWMFNGKDFEFEFRIGEFDKFGFSFSDSIDVFISLNNVSKEFEYYIKSLMASERNKDNILAEPMPIYTNIRNGLGIFAGYSQNIEKLTLTKPEFR